VGASLIYISTDYVFNGCSRCPYREFDTPNPLNTYGASKLAGEEMVRSFCRRFFIVRTSWVFGAHGANFVTTMLRLGREQGRVRVVGDQVGSPTYARDLAGFLAHLAGTKRYGVASVSEENLKEVRPGYGLPPKYYGVILGKKVNRDVIKGTPVSWEILFE